MSRAELLARRRHHLLAQSRALRAELVLHYDDVARDCSSAIVVFRILNRIRRHPGWIAAGAISLAVVTPRRLSSLMRLASAGLVTLRHAMPLLQSHVAPALVKTGDAQEQYRP